MAALPPSNTVRYFLDYEGPMGKRTMQFRQNGLFTDAQMTAAINAFLTPLRAVIYTTVTFTGLRVAAVGSNVSNPIAFAPFSGTQAGVLAPTVHPRYISFVGRSPGGRRVRIYVYGTSLAVTDDYRLSLAESQPVADAVAFLNGPNCPFSAIDLFEPVWKAYANHGYNAYHQRQKRNVA